MGRTGRMAKRVLDLPLKPLGLELVRRRAQAPAAPSPAKKATGLGRIAHVASLGFAPRVVFDCGAYDGSWAAETARTFPGAQLVLVEPNPQLQPKIRQNVAGIQPAPIVVEAAVGESESTAHLNVWGNEQTSTAGSSLLGHVQGEAGIRVEVKVMTIDAIAGREGKSPDFLKLDLQGFELPALKGATNALKTCELCQIEFGVLEAYIGRSTPRQLLDVMYDFNYTLYDVVDLIYRPYDDALTGGDFIFVKNDSPLRKYKAFR
jgi:FkbM family methyltransferase